MTNNLTYQTSLQSYYAEVNNHPILTEAEEKILTAKLKYENCVESARKLVLSHLRSVIKIAKKYQGYGLPEEDLIQEGNVGLMKAVKKFDPEQNIRLMNYAIPWIKSYILQYILDNWRIVKIATTKAQRKLFFNLRSMKEKFGIVHFATIVLLILLVAIAVSMPDVLQKNILNISNDFGISILIFTFLSRDQSR